MEYLIIWLAIAGACAYFANQKGRSALGWFVIGFLLSFIALIILWV